MNLETDRTEVILGHRGKFLAIFAAFFACFTVFFAILEQIGVPERTLGFLLVGATLILYAVVGLRARTGRLRGFHAANHNVPGLYGGMATAASWMSGTTFLAMAGTLYMLGHDALAYLVGWAGGFVLIALFVAPHLRASGCVSLPDFLALRFRSRLVGLIGLAILLVVSFSLMTAQIRGAGLIAERYLEIPGQTAIYLSLAVLLCCAVPGGMRGVSWTQACQFIVLIIAFIAPIAVLSMQRTGWPIPQFAYGDALQQIQAIEQQIGILGPDGTPEKIGQFSAHLVPFASYDRTNVLALIFTLILGTAAMPHLLGQCLTAPTVREARRGAVWGVFFVALILLTIPAYAAFVKLEVLQSVVNRAITDLPNWVFVWGEAGSIKICGAAATSITEIEAACGGRTIVRPADFSIARDVIVLAVPDIAGLPYIVLALVGAGALAAALSTASGLLFAMGNSLAHDFYCRLMDPEAPAQRRLFVTRLALAATAGAGTWIALQNSTDILLLVAWSFSLAAAGFMPVMLLGLFWKRCNSRGAAAGMSAGFLVTLSYMASTQFFDMSTWFGIQNVSAAVFGVPVGLITAVTISLLTQAEDPANVAGAGTPSQPEGTTPLA